jgi:hypothetical protein
VLLGLVAAFRIGAAGRTGGLPEGDRQDFAGIAEVGHILAAGLRKRAEEDTAVALEAGHNSLCLIEKGQMVYLDWGKDLWLQQQELGHWDYTPFVDCWPGRLAAEEGQLAGVSPHLPPDRKHWGNLVVEVGRREVGVNHPLGVENKLHNPAVAEREVDELERVEVWGCTELEEVESAEVV